MKINNVCHVPGPNVEVWEKISINLERLKTSDGWKLRIRMDSGLYNMVELPDIDHSWTLTRFDISH